MSEWYASVVRCNYRLYVLFQIPHPVYATIRRKSGKQTDLCDGKYVLFSAVVDPIIGFLTGSGVNRDCLNIPLKTIPENFSKIKLSA